jgi:sugar phosphate isomerase/epimerase
MAEFKISLASYSFHGMLGEGVRDVFGYLDALKYRHQLDWADIWTGFIPTLDDAFIRKVRQAMDARGIQLANLCVDGPCVWVDTPEKRQANKAQMLRTIQAAQVLGAKTIRIDFGGKEGHTMTEEAFDWIVATYREYCALCGNLGMRIGPENHWGWDRVPAYLERVRAAVDSPAYGHLYHFTNFYDEPEKGQAVAIAYAMHTHIPANSLPVAKETIRKLAASGYAGTYSVEHHSGAHEAERVEWQLGAVRNCIVELKAEGIGEPAKADYVTALYQK